MLRSACFVPLFSFLFSTLYFKHFQAKKVEIEMKAALGEEKYAEFEKCILSAINLLAKSR